MTDILDTLKQGGEDTVDPKIDYLIIELAILARATLPQYKLTYDQQKIIMDRFAKITAAHPEIYVRVNEVYKPQNRNFWDDHSNSVLKYLHDAGILMDYFGLPAA